MRSLNSVRNLIVALVKEFMLVVFGLILPRLIIDAYGSEINGLASAVNNVLKILNLLQVGAAGASIFQMYRPAAENDFDKISVIMDSTRKFFCRVGIIFLLLVLAFSPAFGFFVKGNSVSFSEKIIAFLILGVNGAMYMFFTSYFDVLFSSFQKRYVLSLAAIAGKLLYYGLVFVIVLLKLNFMFLYVATLIGTVFDVVILYIVYSKTYKPYIKGTENNDYKIPYRGYILVDQIAIQAITSLPVVLVSLVGDLSKSSVFSVYFLVYTMIQMVFNTMELSVSAVFGNLTVTRGQKDEKRVFDLLNFIFAFGGIFACTCMTFLYMPFIYVYTKSNTLDVNYLYPVLSYGLVVLAMFFCVTQPYITLTNSHGYYKETYLQSAVCAAIGIALSVGLSLIDWTLVVVGPIFFYICTFFYRMLVAKKRLSWLTLNNSIRRLAVMIFFAGLSSVAAYLFYGKTGYPTGWSAWVLHAVVVAVATLLPLGIYTLLFEKAEFVQTIKYGKTIILRKRKARKK